MSTTHVATQDTQVVGNTRDHLIKFDPKEDIMNSFREHLESYSRALRQMDNSVTGTPSISFASTLGNMASAFHVTPTDSPWIVDSGASNHMTGSNFWEDDW